VSPTLTEFAQGEVEMTGNKLDVCLKGQGFLEVRVGNETRYTRDGHLTLDKDGLLITADDGYPVLNGDGQPIQVDPSQDIVIKADGQICQNGTPVAQLKVVQFDHLQALKKVGDNLYVNEAKAASHAAPANLIVGALERSSVDPVTELVAMIETQRAYEANAQMIRLQDGMLGTVINGLTQNM
jgi:flagellar basal body rod protein FlgG